MPVTTSSTAEIACSGAAADVDDDDDTVTVMGKEGAGVGAAVVGAGGDGDAGGEVGALVDEATFKLKLYVSWHEAIVLSHSMTR